MGKLPGNDVLEQLHLLGMSDAEIAARYEVTRQAVNKRLVDMELRSKSRYVAHAHDLVPWQVKTVQGGKGTHHTAYPLESLKLYLRALMEDPHMTPRQVTDAERFERRLLNDPRKVLDYDRDKGFFWRYREPEDGSLIVAWPKDVPSKEKNMELLEMPKEAKLAARKKALDG
ncbi:hypothetical protein [Streptomyces poonensis]|uniref:Uncharacterized protein n=1 Tax=Streptomyces poonensis TaxID=68255 RepID=A0A918Q3D6_9ACTN|nr:hypothetical protein [Streptomyces poonensis]GGZ29330.1 hypothetical protein GCM10010365_57080 [Streptomyces poonensis]